ncbi:MAG TPA: tetratricopeptide repeat protein [Nitrospirota bacterium]|nr:tetratricopeptide repeat protein [Nitrospirota bacterium]
MKTNALKTIFLSILLILSVAVVARAASSDLKKADRLFSQGKCSEALPLYQKMLADPKARISAGDIHARIGDCHFRLQDYPNAATSYRAALPKQKVSQQPVTQYWIGFSIFAQGRDEEAISEFLKIPQLYPASGMWVSTAYYWAGRASERLGNKDQAAVYYRKAGGAGKASQEQFALKRAEAVKASSK